MRAESVLRTLPRWRSVRCRTLLVGSALCLTAWQPVSAQSRMEKLERGAANLAFGVAELPDQVRSCSTHPEFLQLVDRIGILKYPFCLGVGVAGAGLRELLGFAELLTAPVPWPWRDYRSPYESFWIMDEYPWQ